LSKHEVLLSQPYNIDAGVETKEPKNTRRFYAEAVGFGLIEINEDFDYTSVDEIDQGWMQISCSDNKDVYGGKEGRMSELLAELNDDAVLAKLVNEVVERGI
jgi:hypothetical protein